MEKTFYNQGQTNTLFFLATQSQEVNILSELLKAFPEHSLQKTYAGGIHIWNHFLKDNMSTWKVKRLSFSNHLGFDTQNPNLYQDFYQSVFRAFGNPWTTPGLEKETLQLAQERQDQKNNNRILHEATLEIEELIPVHVKESPAYIALHNCSTRSYQELNLAILSLPEAKKTLDQWHKEYHIHPVTEALKNGDNQVLKAYLDLGLDPNLQVDEGYYKKPRMTSLLALAQTAESAALLVAAGAKIEEAHYHGKPVDLLEHWGSRSNLSGQIQKMVEVVLKEDKNPDTAIDAFILNSEKLNVTEFKRFYKQENPKLPLQIRSVQNERKSHSVLHHFIASSSDIKKTLSFARAIIAANEDQLHLDNGTGETWITHILRHIRPMSSQRDSRNFSSFEKFGEQLQKTTSWKLTFPENLYESTSLPLPDPQTVQNVAHIMKDLFLDTPIAFILRANITKNGNPTWLDKTFLFNEATLNTVLPDENIPFKTYIQQLYIERMAQNSPTPLSQPYNFIGGILNQSFLNRPLNELMYAYLSHPQFNLATKDPSSNPEEYQHHLNQIIEDKDWQEQVLGQYNSVEKELTLMRLLGRVGETYNLFDRRDTKVGPAAALTAALLEHGTKHYLTNEQIDQAKVYVSDTAKVFLDQAFLKNKVADKVKIPKIQNLQAL